MVEKKKVDTCCSGHHMLLRNRLIKIISSLDSLALNNCHFFSEPKKKFNMSNGYLMKHVM